MKLRIMNTREKKQVVKLIKEQFGCDYDFEEVFISSKNKLFITTKDIAKVNLDELRINNLGLYFGELYDCLRLSMEGAQIIGRLAKKNVLELNDSNAARWLAGENIELNTEMHGYVIVKNKDDILGCGKVSKNKLYNYVPKERRV